MARTSAEDAAERLAELGEEVDPPGQPAERLLGPVVVTLLAERRRNGALGDVHEISLQESYVDRVDRDRSYIGVPGSA